MKYNIYNKHNELVITAPFTICADFLNIDKWTLKRYLKNGGYDNGEFHITLSRHEVKTKEVMVKKKFLAPNERGRLVTVNVGEIFKIDHRVLKRGYIMVAKEIYQVSEEKREYVNVVNCPKNLFNLYFDVVK